MAGILVGAGGPAGFRGVATGASVLPIRVAGWQLDAHGKPAVYARTDQLLAGLERAVDPNGDGDAHDAARVALVALSRAVRGVRRQPGVAGRRRRDGARHARRDAPAGNDGPAGPGYGSVSGPGGAPAALTVGAVDERTGAASARLVLRAGLQTVLDGTGAARGRRLAACGRSQRRSRAARRRRRCSAALFDRHGFSKVAGRDRARPRRQRRRPRGRGRRARGRGRRRPLRRDRRPPGRSASTRP